MNSSDETSSADVTFGLNSGVGGWMVRQHSQRELSGLQDGISLLFRAMEDQLPVERDGLCAGEGWNSGAPMLTVVVVIILAFLRFRESLLCRFLSSFEKKNSNFNFFVN